MSDQIQIADISNALYRARLLQKQVDEQATQIAQMLVDRLRHVKPHVLRQLKRELRDFNMTILEWK